jgi:hypothetical protein
MESHLKIIFVVFLRKHLMPKQGKTGKNFCHGILKLRLIRFVEDGFKLWYNYVNVNSICGYIPEWYGQTFDKRT